MNLIEVRNVTKSFPKDLFGKQTILQNIDLTVQQGDFVWLRGSNGAGKSTLLKIILGLQEPDIGSVVLCGASPTASVSKLQVGTVFQEVTPPNTLKVKELIELVRSYYPNSLSTREILENVGLTDKQDTFSNKLSGGQKQRLYFAIARIGNPKLLILDEPTTYLSEEWQEVFWAKIEQLRQNGVTILMVTNVKLEQEKLQELATHIITLSNGTLTYNKQPSQAQLQIATATSPPPRIVNPLQVLIVQAWAEMLQLFRTPAYLAGVFLFSALVALMPFENNPEQLNQGVTFFSAVSLLLFSLDRLGKRIAIERVEGWLKLLRVTPLQPSIYIAAKLIMTMVVLISSLATIFAIGIFKFHLSPTFSEGFTLISTLLLGIIPFAMMGIALGYVVPPKALDSIAGLLIPIGIFTCGLVPMPNPSFLQDLIVVSPFFHYREIIQFAAGMDYDDQLVLHILWLVLYTAIAGFTARIAYQRDRLAL